MSQFYRLNNTIDMKRKYNVQAKFYRFEKMFHQTGKIFSGFPNGGRKSLVNQEQFEE